MPSTIASTPTLSDRLVAEAVRLAEESAGQPFDDGAADRVGRSSGGDLERRILARALALPMGARARAALVRLRRAGLWLLAAAMLLAILAGLGAVSSLLARPERPVSLLWALGLLLGPNLLMLALWLLLWPMAGGGGGAGALLVAVARRLGGRNAGGATVAAAAAAGAYLHPAGPGRWWLAAVTHGLWLAFAAVALLALALHLGARQFDFVWETTLLAPSQVAAVVGTVSAPVAALGLPAPGRGPFASGPMAPVTDAGAARQYWARWLLAVVAVYGLLPRLALVALCLALARRADRRYRLDLSRPGYGRLKHRLAPEGHGQVVDPDPGAAAEPALAVLPLCADEPLFTFTLEVEPGQWPPPLPGLDWRPLGRADDAASRRAVLQSLENAGGAGGVVVACSATATPDAGSRRFLAQVRSRSGHALGLVLLNGAALDRRGESTRRDRLADWHAVAVAVGAAGGAALVLEGDGSGAGDAQRLAAWLAGEPAP